MTTDANGVDALIEMLNQEQSQEQSVAEHRFSYFENAPTAQVIVERSREYDDLPKHIVRRLKWLKAAKKLFDKKNSGLRLLTLPGRHRLEIGMYQKAGILATEQHDGQTVLSVVGFENSPESFGLLQATTPRLRRLFRDDLVATLADPQSPAYKELSTLFPFDIINLDLTVNLVAPSEGPYGPVLRAIRACLKLQGNQHDDWLLMLTFRAGLPDTDPAAIEELRREFQNNLNDHPDLKQICHNRYQTIDAQKFFDARPEEALGQFTAKWIVDQAHKHHLQVRSAEHLCYRRSYKRQTSEGSYSIRKLLIHFSNGVLPSYELPNRADPPATWFLEDLKTVINSCVEQDIDKMAAALANDKPDFVKSLLEEIEDLKQTVDQSISLSEVPNS